MLAQKQKLKIDVVPKFIKGVFKMAEQKTPWTWYLLPVLFSIIGGIIGYFLLKDKDKGNAEGLLCIGIVQFVLQILIYEFVW
jgi:hypothetical protein